MELTWKLIKRPISLVCFALLITITLLTYIFQNSKITITYLKNSKPENKSIPVQKTRSKNVIMDEAVPRTADPHIKEADSTQHVLRSVYLSGDNTTIKTSSTDESKTSKSTFFKISTSSPKLTKWLSILNGIPTIINTVSPQNIVNKQHNLHSVMFNNDISQLKGVNSSFANNSSSKIDTKAHLFMCPGPIGRLGNMMFQLSGTFGIAHTLGYKSFIEPSHPLNKFFDIKQTLDINLTNVMSFNEDQCKQRIWTTNKDYMSHNLTTWGYLQAWTYFRNNMEEVRKAFTIKTIFLNEAKNLLNSKTKSDDVLVGIHVRRGDFTSDRLQWAGYTTADDNYIRKAMKWYRRKAINVRFVVASDDMKWCKEYIKGDDVIYSTFSEPIIDLALLSLCHHCIITGGSFGWWGAWLAGGTVVYLKDYPRPGSRLETIMHKREEYYPPHWIGMSNGIH